MKKCSYCAEEIQDEAIKCKHCHSDLKKVVEEERPKIDRVVSNRMQTIKSLKAAGLCFFVCIALLVMIVAVPSTAIVAALTVVVLVLAIFFFLLRAAVLFVGQKAIKTTQEKKDNWNEKNKRKCVNCSYAGGMKYYLATNKGQIIFIILLLFFFIPGIIYWIVVRGRKVCPKCNSTNTVVA